MHADISGSGSDITTGPVDDLLFAIGDAVHKGANEVEDYVDKKVSQGFSSIKNGWDRFAVNLVLRYGDNSTIATDFSEESGEVRLVKAEGLGDALGLIEESDSATFDDESAKRSVTSNIKTQVQALIDSFFLSEM